ncbi:MAG TPA: hypothetical protein H9955_10030 [Candidatus Mediterraneibacter cottocaccae]|nr:hypothetical protein [Candidatus Mediterraneibacter cottocaccae]
MKKHILKMLGIVCAVTVGLSGCAGGGQMERNQDSVPDAAPAGSATAADETEKAQQTENGNAENITAKDNTAKDNTAEDNAAEDDTVEEENMDGKMIVEVGGSRFTATLESNEAVDALVEMMEENPVTIQMSDYSGLEKVGSLGTNLPTSNRQTTTQAGDIVLYQGNQIVMFYGSNSWSYTRLGRIDDLTGWETALGDGDVTVTFSVEE